MQCLTVLIASQTSVPSIYLEVSGGLPHNNRRGSEQGFEGDVISMRKIVINAVSPNVFYDSPLRGHERVS